MKVDKIDLKYDNLILFGKIIKDTPTLVVIDVTYPIVLEGILKLHPDDINDIKYNVDVPIDYRIRKLKSIKTKRKCLKNK